MKQYEPHREESECAYSGSAPEAATGDHLAVADPAQPYHVCYAPVFRESSPFFCLLLAIFNALALLFLLLIYLFTRNPGILCAIRRIQYRLKHCGEGNSDPNIVLLDPYAEHVHSWRMTYGKDAAWEQWMLDNRSRYEPVFHRAAARPSTLAMAFRYDTAPIAYNPPWASEAEHMTALETYMELAYPGYNFLFQFNGNTTSSYANVIAGIPTNSSQQSGKNVFLYYETIINHEFAHVMAMPHHYDTPADIGNGQHMPPGETQCIMDRTINQFCSGCRTALMIPLNVDNAAQIMVAANNISSRYPY